MNPLVAKIKEVTRTLLPVVILVLFLCLTIVDVEASIIIRFLVGSAMLLIGLSVFLWGVDMAMNPIGERMSWEVATSSTPIKTIILSFLLGFLITVAEPDLLILGSQVESASGGTLGAAAIVYMVSVGVGVMISFGVFRLLWEKKLNLFMAITYGIILVLAFLVSEEFLAISFDASGATTGALTTPFVLALSLGLSKVKGGKLSEENSFGLVGIMSAGPILAVMLMSIISGQRNIQGEVEEFVAAEGVFGPILRAIPHIFVESLVALLPIAVLFFIFNFIKFKLHKDDLLGIIQGLVIILLGLVLFLTAVNSGFMDMGRIIGTEIANMSKWVLIGLGFLLGFIVVLVEPAVHVLGEQIEDVTGGHIPLKIIRLTLSISVALAVALSMVRIIIPEVKLWYFLLPGFAVSVLLSFKADPVFVGIAFDAGGVASGPITATFVLAFAQGAASMIETANVLVDGFGIIAMVAMAPVLAIMVLGTAFKHKRVEYTPLEESADIPLPEENGLLNNCIMVVVNRGFAEKVIDVARLAGAAGATIIHGRDAMQRQRALLPIINVELQPEKDIVLLITNNNVCENAAEKLSNDSQLAGEGEITIYISPAEAVLKTPALG